MLRKGEGGTMPWVVRDAIDDINRAVGRRWQGMDRLLPGQADLPEGCAAPLVASGANGRPVGLGVCRHQFVPADYAQMNPLSAPFLEPDGIPAALDRLGGAPGGFAPLRTAVVRG
jgi:hypothetical protein